MFISYVDESHDENEYWLAAVLLRPHAIDPLNASFRDIVARVSAEFGVSPGAEIHAHHLMSGKGEWRPMHEEVRARIGVFQAAFDAIAASDARLVICGCDLRCHEVRYGHRDVHVTIMKHLLGAIDEVCSETDSLSLIVADNHDQAIALNRDLGRHKTAGIRRVVGDIHFVDSHTNGAMQAADLVAFVQRRRRQQFLNADSARATAGIWSRVEGNVSSEQIWCP